MIMRILILLFFIAIVNCDLLVKRGVNNNQGKYEMSALLALRDVLPNLKLLPNYNFGTHSPYGAKAMSSDPNKWDISTVTGDPSIKGYADLWKRLGSELQNINKNNFSNDELEGVRMAIESAFSCIEYSKNSRSTHDAGHQFMYSQIDNAYVAASSKVTCFGGDPNAIDPFAECDI